MWHKLCLSTVLGLMVATTVAAQPPWPQRYPPRREPPPIPRQEQRYRSRDSREVWRYSANRGGSFEHLRGRQWAEFRTIGEPLYYREVARTPEYVELYDEGRELSVRIYPDRLYTNDGSGEWSAGLDGQWE